MNRHPLTPLVVALSLAACAPIDEGEAEAPAQAAQPALVTSPATTFPTYICKTAPRPVTCTLAGLTRTLESSYRSCSSTSQCKMVQVTPAAGGDTYIIGVNSLQVANLLRWSAESCGANAPSATQRTDDNLTAGTAAVSCCQGRCITWRN